VGELPGGAVVVAGSGLAPGLVVLDGGGGAPLVQLRAPVKVCQPAAGVTLATRTIGILVGAVPAELTVAAPFP
jgi:hypothetical protein